MKKVGKIPDLPPFLSTTDPAKLSQSVHLLGSIEVRAYLTDTVLSGAPAD